MKFKNLQSGDRAILLRSIEFSPSSVFIKLKDILVRKRKPNQDVNVMWMSSGGTTWISNDTEVIKLAK